MFFLLSKILEFLLLPLTWILFLSGLGLLRYRRPAGKRFLLASFFMLLFFTNPFIINTAVNSWEVDAYSPDQITEPYDVTILLGGSMRYFNSELNRPVYSPSVDRLMQTISLYHLGKTRKILLSGGSGRIHFPEEKESRVIREVLISAGVRGEDIILETESRNTYENAAYTARVLDSVGVKSDRLLLITSAWHMRRSMGCFAKAGLDPDPFPVDERSGDGALTPDRLIIPSSSHLDTWDMLLHEWFGCIVYSIVGYI